jgi:HKD family nuclease
MKTRYRLTRRGIRGNKFYCVDTTTGKRTSLRTTNEDEARQIVEAKNNSERQPVLNLQIAKAYLAGTDNGIATRTWQSALESLINTKEGENQRRWRVSCAQIDPSIVCSSIFASDNFAGRGICSGRMAKLDFLLQAVTARFHADELKKLLSQKDCQRVIGSVAFVLEAGISAIAPQLKSVSKVATFFIGIRNDITSVQAVRALLGLGVRIYAVDTGTRSVIFHPKLFLSEGKTTARLVIGSANMTFNGLHNNIEAGVILDLDLTNKDDKQFIDALVKTLEELPAQFPITFFRLKMRR